MSASIRATPRGVKYLDAYGGGMEIALLEDGVEVSVSDGVEAVVVTIPDDVWVTLCQHLVRGQDNKLLVFKDRMLLNAGRKI